MVRDIEQSRSPGGSDSVLSKLRERLKEKEKALEVSFFPATVPLSLTLVIYKSYCDSLLTVTFLFFS